MNRVRPIKIGVMGASGKMGRRIIALANQDKSLRVIFGLERKGHPDVGKSIEGVAVIDDCNQIKGCDCLIDFTTPQATLEHINYFVKFKKAAVIGTTGLEEAQQKKIKEAAKTIPIVFSPNMSVGVNIFFEIIKCAGSLLKNHGYKVYVEEAHHIHKKDAPSGTAKKIVSIVNGQCFTIKNEEVKSIREGEIAGDHRIVFESDVDKIELFHSAKTRDIFAKGAILAAKWAVSRRKGLFAMEQILFPK